MGSNPSRIHGFRFSLVIKAGHTGNKYALDHLRGILRTIQHLKDKEAAVKEATKDFITSSVCSQTPLHQVLVQLEKLHREEGLLSVGLYEHAKEIATRIYAESAEEENEEPVPKPEQPSASRTEPLFCKDTVYHAGICSLAVSTCDAGNLPGLFKNREKVPGHSFKEVSISRSKQDRYLVARQGESTFYFAFQSEPKLSEWPKHFKSFYEGTHTLWYTYCVYSYIYPYYRSCISYFSGVKAQSEKFPVRFLVELLNKRNYIVLTGKVLLVKHTYM